MKTRVDFYLQTNTILKLEREKNETFPCMEFSTFIEYILIDAIRKKQAARLFAADGTTGK
jgi:hypothetical protein